MEITSQTFGFCTAMHNALLPSCTCVLYIVLTPSVLILITFCQAILMTLVWRISVLNQPHEYCTDIVRRNAVLVTSHVAGSWWQTFWVAVLRSPTSTCLTANSLPVSWSWHMYTYTRRKKLKLMTLYLQLVKSWQEFFVHTKTLTAQGKKSSLFIAWIIYLSLLMHKI